MFPFQRGRCSCDMMVDFLHPQSLRPWLSAVSRLTQGWCSLARGGPEAQPAPRNGLPDSQLAARLLCEAYTPPPRSVVASVDVPSRFPRRRRRTSASTCCRLFPPDRRPSPPCSPSISAPIFRHLSCSPASTPRHLARCSGDRSLLCRRHRRLRPLAPGKGSLSLRSRPASSSAATSSRPTGRPSRSYRRR